MEADLKDSDPCAMEALAQLRAELDSAPVVQAIDGTREDPRFRRHAGAQDGGGHRIPAGSVRRRLHPWAAAVQSAHPRPGGEADTWQSGDVSGMGCRDAADGEVEDQPGRSGLPQRRRKGRSLTLVSGEAPATLTASDVARSLLPRQSLRGCRFPCQHGMRPALPAGLHGLAGGRAKVCRRKPGGGLAGVSALHALPKIGRDLKHIGRVHDFSPLSPGARARRCRGRVGQQIERDIEGAGSSRHGAAGFLLDSRAGR